MNSVMSIIFDVQNISVCTVRRSFAIVARCLGNLHLDHSTAMSGCVSKLHIKWPAIFENDLLGLVSLD